MFCSMRMLLSLLMTAFLLSDSTAEIPEAAKQDPRFKLGYLPVTAYAGVSNDGSKDSTEGIQQAIDDSFANNLTLLFPAGDYLISDSLKCYKYQLWSAERASTATTRKKSATTPMGGGHVLLGDASQRPVIRLAAQAKGFNDPEKPRPMIAFRNFRAITPAGAEPGEPENPLDVPKNFEDATANLFGVSMSNIDFDCGGNPGAIGVKIATAQVGALTNVKVNAEGAYAGFHGLPGRNSITANIEVNGGMVGLILKGSLAGSVIAGLNLTGQTENAIDLTDFCPLAIAGFEIHKAQGPAIKVSEHKNMSNGSMSLIDGKIEVGEGEVAFDNSVGKSLYLRNVYIKGAQSLLKSGTQEPLKAETGWNLIKEYTYSDQTPLGEDDPPYDAKDAIFRIFSVIDGKASQEPQPVVSLGTVDAPPDNLVARHVWDKLPIYTGEADETIIATDANYGATADDYTDDLPAIQKAIDDASKAGHGRVFLPAGTYLISQTLNLRANTVLSGAGWRHSIITAHPDWIPAPGEREILVQTIDDAVAATTLGFLSLRAPAEKFDYDPAEMAAGLPIEKIPARHRFTTLLWRAGRDSMIVCVETVRNNLPVEISLFPGPIIHFTGNGGGRHYAIQPRPQAAHRDCRGVLIEGTHEPLAIYGLNSEKPYSPKPGAVKNMSTSEWMDKYALATNVEVKNAKNVRIYTMKREGASPSLIIRDSQNVALFSSGAMREATHKGLGGYIQIVGKSDDVLVSTSIVQQANSFEGKGKPEEPLLREAIDGQQEVVIEWPESVSVYKRGELDDSMFSRTTMSASVPAE